jgi:hypothetical protein
MKHNQFITKKTKKNSLKAQTTKNTTESPKQITKHPIFKPKHPKNQKLLQILQKPIVTKK